MTTTYVSSTPAGIRSTRVVKTVVKTPSQTKVTTTSTTKVSGKTTSSKSSSVVYRKK